MNMPGERGLRVGDGWFDPIGGVLALRGRTSRLRPRTAALFAHLVQHPDRVLAKDELMQAVWPDVVVTEDSLVQCVKEIRQALGEPGRDWIRTVPRLGYAFVAAGSLHGDAPALAATPTPPVAAEPPRRRATWVALAMLPVIALLVLAGDRALDSQKAPAPSVLVMPLTNRTQGAVQDDAVDELTERLTSSLSQTRGTTVIAAGTAFTFKGKAIDARQVWAELGVHYVLEGTLRQQPERLVLQVRLVDATNAAQLWSEEFTAQPGRADALRDDVLARVANSLGLRLIREEAARSRREHPRVPAAADLLTRALAALRWSGPGQEGIQQARQLLEQAVQHDPQLAEAWGLLAMTYLDNIRFNPEREQMLQRAAGAAERVRALAPDSALSHEVTAKVLYNQGHRMEQALMEFDRAIELRPNDPVLHAQRGAALGMLGRSAQGLPAIERAIELSPRDPQLPNWLMIKGAVYLHLGRDAEAAKVLEQSLQANPHSVLAQLFLTSAYGLAGPMDAAKKQGAQLLALVPGFSIGRMRQREPSDEPAFRAEREHVYEGLRRAGLPD